HDALPIYITEPDGKFFKPVGVLFEQVSKVRFGDGFIVRFQSLIRSRLIKRNGLKHDYNLGVIYNVMTQIYRIFHYSARRKKEKGGLRANLRTAGVGEIGNYRCYKG